jgi:ABC-2 type transport system permease protein
MTTLTSAESAPPGPPSGAPLVTGPGAPLGRASMAVARRSLLKFFRTPSLVIVSTVQGAMFLLIFRYVFGGAIQTTGVSYVDFLVPGFVTTTVLFAGSAGSVGVAEDLESGLYDRLRSLPIPQGSVLGGRALADTTMLTWNLFVTTVVGFLVGFRLHGSVLEGLAAFALCVVFGFAFEWLFILIGLIAGNAQAAQGMSLLIFPFTFVSSAFVPVESMPGWLQGVAKHQPITVMVDTVRSLCLGDQAHGVLPHGTGYYLAWSVGWSVVLLGVFLPLAVHRFNRS